jgi:nitronate monooxygenase
MSPAEERSSPAVARKDEAMDPLSTPWSRAMGLRAPILNAPMGGVAGGRLAAAVSTAGGLGMIGVGSAGSIGLVEHESQLAREAGRPFGIGLLGWAVVQEPALLRAAIEAGPRVISMSFGEDWSWCELARAEGITAVSQIFDVESARRAASAGVQVLVARGAEGGGHGAASVGTLPLLEAVLDSVEAPVLAAGGISTPRGLAAVLAAGASGAWLGTAFAACSESLAPAWARQAMIEAAETDTISTRAFDVALGHPWPRQFPERVLRNEFSARWTDREEELAEDEEARVSLSSAIDQGDGRIAPVNAGQGVGMLREVRSAGSVVAELVTGASRLLHSWDA